MLNENLVIKDLEKRLNQDSSLQDFSLVEKSKENSEPESKDEIEVLDGNELPKDPTESANLKKPTLPKSPNDQLGSTVERSSEAQLEHSAEEVWSFENEVEIPVCELRKGKEEAQEETSVVTESRLIKLKRALARYKGSIFFWLFIHFIL